MPAFRVLLRQTQIAQRYQEQQQCWGHINVTCILNIHPAISIDDRICQSLFCLVQNRVGRGEK